MNTEVILAVRPDKKYQKKYGIRRGDHEALTAMTRTYFRESDSEKAKLTPTELDWITQSAQELGIDVKELELMVGKVNKDGTKSEDPHDYKDASWRRDVRARMHRDEVHAHIAEHGRPAHELLDHPVVATTLSTLGLKGVHGLGDLAFREHYEGPKLEVKEHDYPQLVADLRQELVNRVRPDKAKELTGPMAPTAKEVVDRAQIRAQARLEDYTQKTKHKGIISRIASAVTPGQGLLRGAWFHREGFEAEHHHLNVPAELILEEVLGEGDVRSALKAVNKLVGTEGWDGKRKRSLLGAIDDAIGIFPFVPEAVVEKLDEKLDEQAVIGWAARNPEKFLEKMLPIEIARELTRIRHENHYNVVTSTVAKLFTGGSKS